MKQISGDSPKRHVLPLRLATLVAAALVLFVVGSSTAIVWSLAQYSKNGTPHSNQAGPSHIATTPTPVNVRQQAHDLVQQFHAEVEAWGAAHLYHDSYDGHDYRLDSAYMQAGIGGLLDDALARAKSDADFQAVVEQANTALFNYHMFQAAYNDHTPYTSAHDSDLQLLSRYQLKGQVVVVSLAEQAMRVYQDGHLLKSFLVTTGRLERPSLPGVWHALYRVSPTTFKSGEPKSSPLWYPDTHINYAIEYHTSGYFIHDGWWRVDFGPGTQFPHKDAGGNQNFAGNGGMGAIQLSKANAGWLYQNTNLNTTFVVY